MYGAKCTGNRLVAFRLSGVRLRGSQALDSLPYQAQSLKFQCGVRKCAVGRHGTLGPGDDIGDERSRVHATNIAVFSQHQGNFDEEVVRLTDSKSLSWNPSGPKQDAEPFPIP